MRLKQLCVQARVVVMVSDVFSVVYTFLKIITNIKHIVMVRGKLLRTQHIDIIVSFVRPTPGKVALKGGSSSLSVFPIVRQWHRKYKQVNT